MVKRTFERDEANDDNRLSDEDFLYLSSILEGNLDLEENELQQLRIQIAAKLAKSGKAILADPHKALVTLEKCLQVMRGVNIEHAITSNNTLTTRKSGFNRAIMDVLRPNFNWEEHLKPYKPKRRNKSRRREHKD